MQGTQSSVAWLANSCGTYIQIYRRFGKFLWFPQKSFASKRIESTLCTDQATPQHRQNESFCSTFRLPCFKGVFGELGTRFLKGTFFGVPDSDLVLFIFNSISFKSFAGIRQQNTRSNWVLTGYDIVTKQPIEHAQCKHNTNTAEPHRVE